MEPSKFESATKNKYFIYTGFDKPLDILADDLDSDLISGLNKEKISERVEIFGLNKIITNKPSIWEVYLAPLFDTLIVIYLIMTAILFVLAFFVEGLFSKIAFWLVMIVFNMTLAIFQQFRAQKKLEALQQLSTPKCRIIREGTKFEINSDFLVPGDIIELAIGDKIPADARIIKSSNLTVSEAALTGESDPVEKVEDGSNSIDTDAPISQRSNMLYFGTFVQTGDARAIIVRIGNFTELGKIATAMEQMQTTEIPLRRRVNAIGKALGVLMISFLILVFTFKYFKRKSDGEVYTSDIFTEDLADSVINAMSVMPINIPLLTTVILITGVLHMANKQVIVKELSVVESLGRCSVLCSDKTGTMTTSHMTTKLLWDTDNYFAIWLKDDFENALAQVEEEDLIEFFEKQMDTGFKNEIQDIEHDSPIEVLLTSAILNNTATLVPVEGDETGNRFDFIGNPTDGALLILSRAHGLNQQYLIERYIPLKSYPFNSSVKRMSGLFKDTHEDDYMIFVKGASSVILPLCTNIGSEDKLRPLKNEEKKEIKKRVDKFANEGYRVISMAYKAVDNIPEDPDRNKERELVESELTYIGFAVIYDPPRPHVKEAVAELDRAGIFPIMITGDSPETAGTIARQVGILDQDEIVVEGHQSATLPDEEFFKVSVFARVSPQDKETIVTRYQDRGDVVAMTGDGINDALAITKSDAGVAMGITGTEVTKEAADLILADDSYVSLVNGVEEGRNLYIKIRMMIFFFIAVNLAEAIIYLIANFSVEFQILNNFQRVYIFTIVHSIPVLAIIFGPPDKKTMRLKPRANDAIITRKLLNALLIYVIALAISVLSIYYLYYNDILHVNSFNEEGIAEKISFRPPNTSDLNKKLLPWDLEQAKARTMLLTVIYLAEAILVLSIRRMNSDIFSSTIKDSNNFVKAIVFFPLIVHFSMMYITPLQNLLFDAGMNIELIRLNPLDLLVVFSFAALPIILLELYKWYNRKQVEIME